MNCYPFDRAMVVRGHYMDPCIEKMCGAVIKCGAMPTMMNGVLCWVNEWGPIQCTRSPCPRKYIAFPDSCLKPMPEPEPEPEAWPVDAPVQIPEIIGSMP